jgi:hypothetical protein
MISIKAGVEGQSDWNAGTVMADGDGYLDIYVCVVGINGFEGHNELFINKNNTLPKVLLNMD